MRIRALISVTGIAAVMSLAIPLACLAQPAIAEKPAIKLGQVAVYVVQELANKQQWEDTQTITAIEGDLVKVNSVNTTREPREREVAYTTEWNTVISPVSGTRITPHGGQMQFPLELGKSWPAKFESLVPSGARLRADLTGKVVAVEKVQVPAGTFEAFKIEQTGWNNGVSFSGVLKVWQATWYAPAIGRVVRSEYKDWAGSNLPRVHNVVELKSLREPS